MSFKSRRPLSAEQLEPRMLMAANVMAEAVSPAGFPSVDDGVPAYVAGDVAPVISEGAAAELAHPTEDIWPDTISLPAGFEPKGIELGRGHDFFVSAYSWSSLLGPVVGINHPVSPNAGAIYKGDLQSGEGDILVQPTGRPLLGLSYDARTDYIYAAVGDPAVFGGTFTNAGVVIYDGTSGEQIAAIILGDGPFLSGILVTKSAVFATTTNAGILYKLPLEKGGRLPSSPAFGEIVMTGFQAANGFYAWGLEGSFDGKDLLILNGLNGSGVLYHVDTTSGVSTPIKIDGVQQSFEDGDELHLSGRTLYISQVFSRSIAVIQLSGDLTEGTFVKAIESDALRSAHSLIGFGDSIYAVNSNVLFDGTDEDRIFGDSATIQSNIVKLHK